MIISIAVFPIARKRHTVMACAFDRGAHAMKFGGPMRRFLVAVLAATMLLALALPVAAAVRKSGEKYCSTWQTPWVRSYSTGFTEHYPPGQGYQWYQNGPAWTVRVTYANGSGGLWLVKTDGSLSNPGTYAGCANF